jgi:valyl-tRNA synthetase
MDLKQEFIDLGKTINWRPEYMRVRYENWVKGLQWDWCVSRQRFFGIPFPVWYCEKCGKAKLAEIKDLPVNPEKDKPKTKCSCGSNKFIPEQDILDTWATSSLTPQIAIELLKNEKLKQNIIPMSLRPQAHDIINTWLFYTLARSKLHLNKIPWRNVLISGFVLDPNGEKMSKSKGNIIEPPKVMKNYPVDALRYWSAEAGLGKNLRFDEEELKNGHRLMTKLWNASRFSFFHLKNFKGDKPKELEPLDKWLFSKLQATIKNSSDYFEKYEFAKAKQEIENFFWKTFCDNYLELAKRRLYSPKNRQEKISARYTLYTTLLTILKLWAPIIPYITEEIYQSKFKKLQKTKSIHITKLPEYNQGLVDKEIEAKAQTLIDLIAIIRKEKSSKGYSLKKEIRNLTISADKNVIEALSEFQEDLKAIGNISFIGFGNFTLADKNIITISPSLKIRIEF